MPGAPRLVVFRDVRCRRRPHFRIPPPDFFITSNLCAPSHTPNPTSATMFSDWDSAELCRSPETALCVSNSLITTSGAKSGQQAVAKSRKIGPEQEKFG